MIANDGTAAICPRTETGGRYIGEAGYMHKLVGQAVRPPRGTLRTTKQPTVTAEEWEKFASEFQDDLSAGDHRVLAKDLGVSVESLARLAMGWCEEARAFTFPMRDENGAIVGIRLRSSDGRKWALRGSANGLFIPINGGLAGQVFVCEGPTDTAALVTLGFDAIGRPFRSSSPEPIAKALREVSEIVVVSDTDADGKRDAKKLCMSLVGMVDATVKLILPVNGKDARAWVQAGATANLVRFVAANAETFSRSRS